MEKEVITACQESLTIAKDELTRAIYLEECGSNAGIRKMNANKANWLKWLIYLAELGLERETAVEDDVVNCEECPVKTEMKRILAVKDNIISQLSDKNADLENRAKALQTTYECEVEYRKVLIAKANLDWCTKIAKKAHDDCWLDGTVLVCPVENIDRLLLELFEE